jgi:serine/threonine protein kinase
MNPPLHEIHPMKALMMIPMRDPPTFTAAEKWTRDFRDFVTSCLQKSPERRKNAAELLEHPFVTAPRDKAVLIELINKRRRAEAKEKLDENSESESDLDSDEEEVT